MKKIVVLFAIAAFAGSAFAAAPETVVLKNAKGNVTFGHAAHEKAGHLKECTKCHADAAGGKIPALGKEKGHAACLDCHKKAGKPEAPTGCMVCHKK